MVMLWQLTNMEYRINIDCKMSIPVTYWTLYRSLCHAAADVVVAD